MSPELEKLLAACERVLADEDRGFTLRPETADFLHAVVAETRQRVQAQVTQPTLKQWRVVWTCGELGGAGFFDAVDALGARQAATHAFLSGNFGPRSQHTLYIESVNEEVTP